MSRREDTRLPPDSNVASPPASGEASFPHRFAPSLLTLLSLLHLSPSGARSPGASPPAKVIIRWSIFAAAVALSPLVVFRVIEHVAATWTSRPWGQVGQYALPSLGMLAVAVAVGRLVPPLPRLAASQPLGNVSLSVAMGVLLGAIAGLVNFIAMLALRREGATGIATIDARAATVVLHVILMAPLAEEVTFRGLIYRIFRQKMLPGMAAVLSAAVFSIMHRELGRAVWAFCLGLVTASGYEQTRSVLTPVLIHALFNAAPVGMAVLRAKPQDTGPVWLVLTVLAVIFTVCARSARHSASR